ncbi:MAG: phosphoenolpyruvate synthase, partial [Armatimonadota bacterium]
MLDQPALHAGRSGEAPIIAIAPAPAGEETMGPPPIHSGFAPLDDVLQGLRYGDNVVWQVDSLDDYRFFADAFARTAAAEERDVVYLRFAPHPPAIDAHEGITVRDVDPGPGFDQFTAAVHRIIEERGERAFYIFDDLSSLVAAWATDELLANFFQVTCPYLADLDTVAYFALARGRHAHSAIARIRDTTQLLIDVYRVGEDRYVHPLKVWDRYSPQMFLPHRASGDTWSAVSYSGDAAEAATRAHRQPLQTAADTVAPWESVFNRLLRYDRRGAEAVALDPEALALKQELCQMMMGSQPEFLDLALRYFTLDDLVNVRHRMIGSGRIGGKAAGMLLARR